MVQAIQVLRFHLLELEKVSFKFFSLLYSYLNGSIKRTVVTSYRVIEQSNNRLFTAHIDYGSLRME